MTLRSVPLDELDVVVIVDNETDTLSSVAVGIPQLPEMASALDRVPPTGEHEGHAVVVVFDHLCVACHGISVLVNARRGADTRSVLFDVGPYGDVWLDNAVRLGVDLTTIETIFLSHWHWDHSGGLPIVIAAVADARRQAGLDPPLVDLHPDRPDQRGVLTPAGVVAMLPEEPSVDAMRTAGGAVQLHDEAHLLADGYVLASGAIPRRTSYETGLAGHVTFRGSAGAPDPLIMDERFLAADVRGRGVTVLSACSHAGIVNACLAARDQYDGAPLDLVLGGYHLAGAAMEQRIDPTRDDLDSVVAPRIVAPGHCTGWRAKAALAERFAPDRYAPSVVGARYVLAATNGTTP
jgi:7,8-dihydropterin-6-yl-methyl-4-(beta-D-ribofuranosyl)aminobenzene 5'-phosphate synthase